MFRRHIPYYILTKQILLNFLLENHSLFHFVGKYQEIQILGRQADNNERLNILQFLFFMIPKLFSCHKTLKTLTEVYF